MGYTLSKKVLAAIVIIAVTLTGVSMAAIFNLGGFGVAVQGAGGPLANGFYSFITILPNWGLSGGMPTALVAFVFLPLAVIFGFAYWVWHWDIGYKIAGIAAEEAKSKFDNTMTREPQEPERAPQTAVEQ